MDATDWAIMLGKLGFVFVLCVHVAPVMAWVERRGSALMQGRLGPNRVGPLGLIQSVADAIKFMFKEDRPPGHVDRFYWRMAPIISLIPAFMTFAVIPFASQMEFNGRVIKFQVAELNVGLLYILSIASLGVFGIIMAGWSSNNKYSLLGALRSSSQMISYELSLGLSIVGIVMVFSTVDLGTIATEQGKIWFALGPITIPKWGILVQPLGFIIFLTSAYAETNRLPFDLPEGESEIVAGYHLEYGSMKFALFMMAEYVNMFTASGLVTTLYFGGWQLLPGMGLVFNLIGWTGLAQEWLRVGLETLSFLIKVGFFMWLFVWVRWTLPRFRYDQLMAFGWKALFPLSLLNLFVTGILIYLGAI